MARLHVTLYDLGISLYRFAISIASVFYWKAALWVSGRRNLKEEIIKFSNAKQQPVVWMHCSSLGEFEQGRPLLEAIKDRMPEACILLSFFSPSGYEVRRDYKKASKVIYIQLDTKANADFFVKAVQPQLAIFVRYDLWYHHITALKEANVPSILISSRFSADSYYFKAWGALFRNMLSSMNQIFVLDDKSKKVLKQNGFDKVAVTGDTRFDRVLAVSRIAPQLHTVMEFKNDRKLLVAGSTWKSDEKLLRNITPQLIGQGYALVIAPHDIQSYRLKDIERMFKDYKVRRYSEWIASPKELPNILLVDNVGKLSAIYRYAEVAYIGGGFERSIHNILEAAVYGVPILFGPKYWHVKEAVDLIDLGGAFPVNSDQSFISQMKHFSKKDDYDKIAKMNAEFVRSGAGATKEIMDYLETIGF